MAKKKTTKQIYDTGKPEDFTISQIMEIVQNLYAKELAEAWFIGMEWVEGYRYCQNSEFLEKTFAPIAVEKHRRAIWFACRFLD